MVQTSMVSHGIADSCHCSFMALTVSSLQFHLLMVSYAVLGAHQFSTLHTMEYSGPCSAVVPSPILSYQLCHSFPSYTSVCPWCIRIVCLIKIKN